MQLQQALKGEIVMSIEMEDAYESVHQVKQWFWVWVIKVENFMSDKHFGIKIDGNR